MYIIDYKFIHGTEPRDGYIAIPELDRYKSSVSQFIKLADLSIVLDKPTAFIYVDGFSVAQSESGINLTCPKKYLPAIKTGASYIMHQWIDTFKGKGFLRHANIVSSTCASSLQALYEAERYLRTTLIEDVVIIGGERTTDDTIRLFKELGIPVQCGDGFFYMKVSNRIEHMGMPLVKNMDWRYTYQSNPFYFPRDIIDNLMPLYPVDYVKLHGTGTESNTAAEAGLETLGEVIMYKPLIGHCQGVSCLLETCLVLDDRNISGKVLVTANGLGGFYGAFTLIK